MRRFTLNMNKYKKIKINKFKHNLKDQTNPQRYRNSAISCCEMPTPARARILHTAKQTNREGLEKCKRQFGVQLLFYAPKLKANMIIES